MNISDYIWEHKYRARPIGAREESSIQDSWQRVARAMAANEKSDPDYWQAQFYSILKDYRFLPGGRILHGAGTGHQVTLFNCFVMGKIHDSMDGIFSALRESALTMQRGGGIGLDFSPLRPKGSHAEDTGTIASGPVSFMRIWNTMCDTLLSTGSRRGAMMATLRCDHPDIEEFVEAKLVPNELRNFNLSVLITDEFMHAVKNNLEWPLVFGMENSERHVYKHIQAKELWAKIMRTNYESAEPGMLFIDTINRENNLYYKEDISATNPCGEIPLPEYGACDLGSINLTKFVQNAFSSDAVIDENGLRDTVKIAVRFLDNVIDISDFPLTKQKEMARNTRRLGLGITGLADALLMLGIRYGSNKSLDLSRHIMKIICYTAYETSIGLAKEKGVFPYFDKDKYLQGSFVSRLSDTIRNAIAEYGIRNSHLTAIAPAGTISLLAGNISSGLEPVYRFDMERTIISSKGEKNTFTLTDPVIRSWREKNESIPDYFVDSARVEPEQHLQMQAALQPYIDNAISKTINVPVDYKFSDFQSLYDQAYGLGLKGCTTFRPNTITGQVIEQMTEAQTACCSIDREAD